MSSAISWMPTQGQQTINMGSSAIRALKARKGIATTSKTKMPERDFYGFRYNFKPPTLDTLKGSIEVKTGKQPGSMSSVVMQQASAVPGENLVFTGSEAASKEMDYILIYDEELGTYTLEKLDTTMTISFDRRSPAAEGNSPPVASTSKSPTVEPDIPKEEEEGEEIEIPLSQVIAHKREEPRARSPAQVPVLPARKRPAPKATKPRASVKPEPAAAEEIEIPLAVAKSQKEEEIIQLPSQTPVSAPMSSTSAPLARAKPPRIPRPTAKSQQNKAAAKAGTKHDLADNNFEFSQAPRKRAKSNSPVPSEGLALPGGNFSAPHMPVALAAPPAINITAIDSDEEDWDEVPTTVVPDPDPSLSNLLDGMEDEADEEEEEEEIDITAFEAEMNQHLEQDDADFPVEEDLIVPAETAVPISMDQLAGESGDEDDYSSSDDSDDD